MTGTKKNLARTCVLLPLTATTASGCTNLNQQQAHALSGGAIGAFTTPSQVHVGR